MLWIITCRRLKRDRRGISNIIVIVLSLVVILAIVSNIVLWNYEMNQLDYEKMKEDITITGVASLTNSSWFVAQNEYAINTGTYENGSYTDTHVTDGLYETFNEASTGSGGILDPDSAETLKDITAESGPDTSADDSENILTLMTDGDLSGSKEIFNYATGGSDFAHWYRRNVDASNYSKVEVRVYFSTLEVTPYDWRVYVYQSDANNIDTAYYVDGSSSTTGWTTIDVTSIIHQLDGAGFIKVRLISRVGGGNEGKKAYIAEMEWRLTVGYSLDLNGMFVIDTSMYSLAHIQTIEIQSRYMVNDTGENWYLKAYNWTASAYSDSGFNSTVGHTPTMGWDYYAVNLTDAWQSYVHDNGTINVKFVDQGVDSDQTSVDVDFLGVRVRVYGSQFTFENDGGLTVHLVSLWISNSTDRQRYDISVFVNSAETKTYLRDDVLLPTGSYTVKVVTERGNKAVYSG